VSWTTENEAWKFSRTGNYDQPYIVTSTEYDPEIIGVLGDVEWYEETVEPANFLTKGNTLMVAPNQTTRYIARVILNVTLPFYDTVTVFVTPNPEIYAGDDTTIMQGTAATLHGLVTNGNGNYFYHWEPVDMVLDPDQRVTQTVDLMFPQVYQLQVTDNQGCESQIDEMVVAIEFGPLFASMTVDHEVVCAGEIVELEVRAFGGDISQPYSYDWWSDPPGFIITDGDPIQYAQPAETTMYFVRVTDANDSTFVDSTLVTVPEIVPVISGQDTICENEQGVVYQTPATGNFFDWSVIGLIPDKIVESGNTVTIDWGKTSGSGYVKVVETTSDIYHCSDSTQFPVTIFAKPEPPVIAGAISICEGTSEFYSISGPSEDTYEWTLLNPECGRFTGDSSGMSVNIDWYQSGNAILYVKQTTPVGCFSGSDLAVSVNPLPSPGILGWASVCEQDTADYYTPLTSGNQYQWDFFPSSAGEIIGTTDDSRLTVFWKQPGKAYLSVRETVGVTSCTTLSDTFEIEVHPKPVITAFPQIIEVCDGDSDTLNLSGADVYYWSPFVQLSWLNDSTWIMKPVISTTYHITGIDTLTGCQDTTSYHSIFKPNPIIDLGPDQYIQPGQTIVLTPGEGFDEYFWNTGATGSDLSITAAGRYEVTVFMNGCIGNDSVWITMPVHYIPVPNAFTPNGDGRNDKFQLVGPMEEITRFKMQIFNRWGYLLFETSDPFDGWDGTYQGEVCDPGSYLWLITFEERSDGNPVSKQGYVNLLK
jgi:gliding motility-associated-like protein